jgi:hypothetical protein
LLPQFTFFSFKVSRRAHTFQRTALPSGKHNFGRLHKNKKETLARKRQIEAMEVGDSDEEGINEDVRSDRN